MVDVAKEEDFFCYLHFIDRFGKYQKYFVKKSDNIHDVRKIISRLFSPKDDRVFLTFKK